MLAVVRMPRPFRAKDRYSRRATVATLLLRNGMDIRVVQEFLGHASIATTQRYTHIVKEHLIGEPKKHHPSFGLRARDESRVSTKNSVTVTDRERLRIECGIEPATRGLCITNQAKTQGFAFSKVAPTKVLGNPYLSNSD